MSRGPTIAPTASVKTTAAGTCLQHGESSASGAFAPYARIEDPIQQIGQEIQRDIHDGNEQDAALNHGGNLETRSTESASVPRRAMQRLFR